MDIQSVTFHLFSNMSIGANSTNEQFNETKLHADLIISTETTQNDDSLDATVTITTFPELETHVTNWVTVFLNFLLSGVICGGNAFTLAAIHQNINLQV